MQGILGIKKGMTQVFNENGLVIPVTIIQAGPCVVTQIKTVENDGYSSVQIAFLDKKESRATKPEKGIFAKANTTPKRFLREFNFSDQENIEIGTEIKADRFAKGDIVKVTGTSKGKGFQGVVKRHKFGGGKSTHGQSDRLRAPGSLGQSSTPSRVFKGLKMAGRMGNDRITLGWVEVIKIDAENGLLYVKGSLPGSKNSVLEISN
jgi:large subunit ribosomal protein L3